MNVNLVFQQTGYSFQISQFTPLSFIYEVASKVFHIPGNSIKLFFKEQYVPNEQTYASNYFKKFPVIINVLENKKPIQSNNINEKAKITEEKSFNETFSEKAKQKKKNFIKCQICNRKNSIFYCRNCNHFICFECNLRFPEHFSHKKISLESGDLLLCFEEYRNNVLEQLNELNNAFRFSSQNIYTDQKRSELFENLINALKDLDKKTQSLTIMGTSYKCSNEVLNSFNKELREIEAPKYKEETINSFGLVNEKELEIQNYISFINLQILKSKFNIKMTIFFKEAKKIFDDLTIEINNKLHDSLNLKEKNYNDLVSYNKEKYKEKDSSTSRSNSISSSSNSNHSLSLNSSSTKNVDDNNRLSEKFNSSNNINNKIDLNVITNKNKKKNSKLINIDNNKNENNSHKNIIYYKNNHTESNLNRINSCSVVVKEENSENNESDDANLLTLPKIKIGNDSNYDINNNRKKIFKSIEKNKKSYIIHQNNINNIKDSMQNILKKSFSQSKEIKQTQKNNNNNNLNTLKLFRNENPINSKEIEGAKILKTIQSYKNFNNSNKRVFSNLKLKLVDTKSGNSRNQNINENNKNRFSAINIENTLNSLDKYETNKILNSLKKIKPNHKIKLYDTYKFKENEANNDNNDKENSDNSIAMKLMKNRNEIEKKRIYQKENK